MTKASTAKPNLAVRFTGYLGDVWRELKRVVWPGRNEVWNSSLVVVFTLGFFILFTFAVDSIVIQLLTLVGSIGGS